MVWPAQVLQLSDEARIQNLTILEVLLSQPHLPFNQIWHDLFDTHKTYFFVVIKDDACLLFILLNLTRPVSVTLDLVYFLCSRQHHY